MRKKIVIGIVVIASVFVALGAWFAFWMLSWVQNPAGPSPYTAIYMISGDIYFGRFSRFPTPRLKDVWFLQRTTGQNNQQQFSVVPFANVFWGPVNELRLNSKQIIFWARLRNDSQVAKGLKDPSLFQAQQGGEVNQLPAPIPATNTPSAPTSSSQGR